MKSKTIAYIRFKFLLNFQCWHGPGFIWTVCMCIGRDGIFPCNFETMGCLLLFHPDELLLDKFQPMKMYHIGSHPGTQNPIEGDRWGIVLFVFCVFCVFYVFNVLIVFWYSTCGLYLGCLMSHIFFSTRWLVSPHSVWSETWSTVPPLLACLLAYSLSRECRTTLSS